MNAELEVFGARENNLKNIDVAIPLNKLVVVTGVSGSGKSSLAFDTIFAEGQRRYLETYSTYIKQFIGGFERPEVDKINGLNPVISIEQKTVSNSPRSTVGTITEIYDFLRLLFARVSTAYSKQSGEKMIKRSLKEMYSHIIEKFENQKVLILSPKIRGRKGHYKELFESILKSGYTKVVVDGELLNINKSLRLDRYKIHDIFIVIDRIHIKADNENRILSALNFAMKESNGNFSLVDQELKNFNHFSSNLVCPVTGESYPDPEPNLFSFNSPYGACKHCHGLGEISDIDLNKIVPDDKKSIKSGGISPLGEYKKNWIFEKIENLLVFYNYRLNTPIHDIDPQVIELILYGNEGLEQEQSNKTFFRFEGISKYLIKSQEGNQKSINDWAEKFIEKKTCPECNGYRITENAFYFKIGQCHIGEVACLDLNQLDLWIKNLKNNLSSDELMIAKEIIKELESRVSFIIQVGLNYLQLNRTSKSLSGGESQRIRLASQIGTKLVNVLYILDEPSIGLHPKDNTLLINSLKSLRDRGNSVIVVEHDREIIENADYLVEIGPKAGKLGGYVSGKGNVTSFKKLNTITSKYINNSISIEVPKNYRNGNGNYLSLIGASGNNLKDIDIHIPLGTFTCITGVSGSGKSTLVNKTLYPILMSEFYGSNKKALPYKSCKGINHLDKVIEINQRPIGRTPRSNPSTYTKVFDEIRKLFSDLPEAKIRGYKPGRFSFNVSGGKCDTCNGGGLKLIEMNFLPDVYIECEDCLGARYNRETLEIKYKGKNISQILNLTISEALIFFENIPKIKRILETMENVGLGYISLGQSSTTLSGGEAQRIKLATELSKKSTGKTLLIMDEPSTGLHFEDIKMLLKVIQGLVDQGNTVLVIEHNLDIIKVSDYIIDLGPGGGVHGGQITMQGKTNELFKQKVLDSHTWGYLQKELSIS